MNAAVLERDAFAPRQPPGMRSGLALAILAHLLLIAALAWSVHWKSSEPEGVVAELWSTLPQTAAPRAAPPEPRPPVAEPRPTPPPTPTVPVKPAPLVKPEPAPPPRVDAQIAIEKAARERARREEAEREQAAKQADIRKREQAEREEVKRAEAKRLEAERQRLADEQAEKKKLAEQAKKEEARQAAIREATLRRMMKEAGSGDESATGMAARTSGPSSGYAGRIKARVKPNIVLTTALDGNPSATVEVRVAPDGTIVGRKLVTSSGSSVYDDAVLRAIDKTEVLPKDVDGRVPPTITIAFRLRD
jgi:colicin import membrane protein